MNELMFSTRARRRLTGRTGFDVSHIARATGGDTWTAEQVHGYRAWLSVMSQSDAQPYEVSK